MTPHSKTCDGEVNNLDNQFQSFSTSLHCIEKGLEYIHRCQKRVAEQRSQSDQVENPKLLLENAIHEVQQALYDQRKQLRVLEHSLSPLNLTQGSVEAMTKSSNSQQHLFHEFCQRHLNMVSEFHDLQSHYAEHQKQLLLKELQLFCHYVTEADLYSDFKDVLETSMGSSRFNDPFFIPILQKLQYQQSELHQLEVGVQEVAQMMADFHLSSQRSDSPNFKTVATKVSPSADEISLHTLVEIEPCPKEPDFFSSSRWPLKRGHFIFIKSTILFGTILFLSSLMYALYHHFYYSELAQTT